MNFNITLDKTYFESAKQEWFYLFYPVSNRTDEEKVRTENQIAELTHKIFMMKERMLSNEV